MTNNAASESNRGPVTNRILAWVVIAILVAIEAALVVKLLDSGLPSVALLTAIVVVAGLSFLAPRLLDIVGLQVGREGLRAELQSVEDKVEKVNDRISDLFLLTMSSDMFHNLMKLESGRFGEYEMGPGLARELYHLRDAGYIEVGSVEAIPKQGDNLSAFVKITDEGKLFVQLRKELVHKETTARALVE